MADGLTNLRLRLIQQTGSHYLKRECNRKTSADFITDQDNQIKLQQAVLRRQELLDRLKTERYMHDGGMGRPRTYSPRRRRTLSPTPSPTPPSRHSLPELSKPPAPNPRPAGHHIQPATPPVQTPQHPILLQPYSPRDNRPNRSDVMEMMMMQNAQMHQMVVHQMLLNSLPQKHVPVANTLLPNEKEEKRPPSVHHHHYPTPLPPVQHPQASPQPTPMPVVPTPAPRPSSPSVKDPTPALMEPAPPRQYVLPAIDTNDVRVTKFSIPQINVIKKLKRKRRKKYPFPGTRRVRKLRRLFYAVLFVKILESLLRKNRARRPGNVFRLRLTDIIISLHAIYLNTDGPIQPLLAHFTQSHTDYSKLLISPRLDNEKLLLSQFRYYLESLVYHITDIMPSSGSLGTNRNSDVFELTRPGQKFPPTFFYSSEKDKLTFNAEGCLVNLNDRAAAVLLLGMFLTRALVTTLLFEPRRYNLIKGSKSSTISEDNLRLLATVVMWLVRRCSVPKDTLPMPFAKEMEKNIILDDAITSLNAKLRKTYVYCEKIIREWMTEYVKRLNAAKTPDS